MNISNTIVGRFFEEANEGPLATYFIGAINTPPAVAFGLAGDWQTAAAYAGTVTAAPLLDWYFMDTEQRSYVLDR